MISFEIRKSFLDFFGEKQHTIVPSSSLVPDSPNLLFTNAGMNQFVPIFLGQQKPAWQPPRVADTQKCIRAGGKHNDLEDVGLDTYHHTFFEMLGNWSFGDYFKKEAIEWAWELVVERWKFPPQRLYATVYKPRAGEPSDFDQEAHDHWARLFRDADLDPAIHIVNGNKKDNFWMMGDTGPCGPCSELHVDLTPDGNTRGELVNKDDPRCIEIWNLVFIQFNANADGTFTPLPQRHVDTGMGFERVTAIIQGTKNLTDFSGTISNYETDVFRPIFDELEKLSSKKYESTLPAFPDRGAHAPPRAAVGASPTASGEAPDAAPEAGALPRTEQEKIDVAFRVLADHIRTLSFAIADGIIPSNEGRGYVLRRILRRAVRYGRTLGFHEPFFFKLVEVVARTMGDVFLEVRAKQTVIKETIRREEQAFNRTLDKGLELFEREVARIPGSARDPRAQVGDSPTARGATYSKRRLPHFERPWGKYMITFSTNDRGMLTQEERDIALECILFPLQRNHYELYAACVMPDHVHLLFEPQIKEQDEQGQPIFYSLGELLQNVKSVSAHRINAIRGATGPVWEKESFDYLIRSERDLAEKFSYVCANPWKTGVAKPNEDYPWLWTQDTMAASGESPDVARESRALPSVSGEFAFKLYDTYGFPLDLTELMARERGLTVDVAGFEGLMEQQRDRARKAQKKEAISVEEGNLQAAPTKFLGYDFLETEAVVEAVLPGKTSQEINIVLDRTACYAEMGGQVGDHGLLHVPGHDRTEVGQLRIKDTQKRGDVFIHRAVLAEGRAPEPGEAVRVSVDAGRRNAIQRHHTVTHILHWALHEKVSREAAQKGSYVGPDKLTFDFSSAALTPQQKKEVERLVNEKIREDATVTWTEISYVDARKRADIQQFFGDKYGDVVRVVQIGGDAKSLNGYSMELCGGTHVRSTGEIESFRIVSEGAIAAGIRRIEAVSGEAARTWAEEEASRQQGKFDALARKKSDLAALPVFSKKVEAGEMLKQIDARAEHLKRVEAEVHEWEKKNAKAAEAELQSRAAEIAGDLATAHGSAQFCVAEVKNADGKLLQAVVDILKSKFKGPIFLAGAADGAVALVASVPKELTARIQADKLIQQVAPIVGGKGGGRPEGARGAGKDASRINQALDEARKIIGS
jgi:alanyl-tRNA synthetase/REP element-mobilizing transposase RayT